MTLKKYARSALAVVLCIGMVPTAFAAQENGYHDPADHWQEANNRTNELDVNAVVTHETFPCLSYPGIHPRRPDGHEPQRQVFGRDDGRRRG